MKPPARVGASAERASAARNASASATAKTDPRDTDDDARLAGPTSRAVHRLEDERGQADVDDDGVERPGVLALEQAARARAASDADADDRRRDVQDRRTRAGAAGIATGPLAPASRPQLVDAARAHAHDARAAISKSGSGRMTPLSVMIAVMYSRGRHVERRVVDGDVRRRDPEPSVEAVRAALAVEHHLRAPW